MNSLQAFNDPRFGNVRAIVFDNEPWFVGKDIASVLGYTDINKAVVMHVDEDDRKVLRRKNYDNLELPLWDGDDFTNKTVINESGVYSLILRSNLDSAKQFKRWITHEVIPSIRKSGGYISGQEEMSDADLMAKALLVAQKQIEQRNAMLEQRDAQIKELTPKALFADAVSASEDTILVGDLAKILKQNGVEIGRDRLFAWMHKHGYLMKYGSSKNVPTQKSMEMGLFEIKETVIHAGDGRIKTDLTPKVTGKGQRYFLKKFMEALNGTAAS